MSAYDLPTSLTVGEVAYPIRYGWRAVLDALIACADPELDERTKAYCVLRIIYPGWEEIPTDQWAEAVSKASAFMDCGQKDDGKPKPKLIDWEQDGALIIPEVNKVAGREIRLDPDMHWWTFFGYFMSIGEGLLSSVLQVRKKKAMHKKLDKCEQEFYKSNRSLVDMKAQESDEVRAEKGSILKYL